MNAPEGALHLSGGGTLSPVRADEEAEETRKKLADWRGPTLFRLREQLLRHRQERWQREREAEPLMHTGE